MSPSPDCAGVELWRRLVHDGSYLTVPQHLAPARHMAAQDGSFSTSDGCKISYTLEGARGTRAPKLALIHSLALDRTIWDGVVERIGDRAEILALDARGHGRSGRPHMAYSAELFARDLAELMDHVG